VRPASTCSTRTANSAAVPRDLRGRPPRVTRTWAGHPRSNGVRPAWTTGCSAEVRNRPDSRRKDWYLAGATAHGHLTAAAVEAGVTVLAGTDSRPHGRVVDEIRAFVNAGVSPHDALAAASWTARSYLGIAGLTDGAPADAVVFDADPRTDLAQLDIPRAVIVRGRLAHSRR
jgi:imidazolonepropionase-like amidohydrolase